MKRAPRIAGLFALAVVLAHVEGCTSACIRQTDCSSKEQCIAGSCIVVAVGDAATVEPMTPAASVMTTPAPASTDSGTFSTLPTTPVTPTDAGSIVVFPKDAAVEASGF